MKKIELMHANATLPQSFRQSSGDAVLLELLNFGLSGSEGHLASEVCPASRMPVALSQNNNRRPMFLIKNNQIQVLIIYNTHWKRSSSQSIVLKLYPFPTSAI